MTIATDVTVSRAVDMAEMKVDTGSITGYALTWDFDGDGYQFERGSFAKTIKDRAGKIPLLITHAQAGGGSILETVGFLTELTEDDTGLLVTGDFLDTELGRATREQAKAGGVKSMSVKARPIKFTKGESAILVQEAKLSEVTLTNIPADESAEVIAVRSEGAGPDPDPLPVTPEPPVATDTPEAVAARERQITMLKLGDA